MVAIHRRVAKDECFVVLRGKVRVTTHDDDGAVIGDVVLSWESGGYWVDILWHRVESLETESVIFECKDDPYHPLEEDEVFNLENI